MIARRVVLIAITLLSAPALATPFTAQVTEVADAADVDNVFDFNASIGFRRQYKEARITREGLSSGSFVVADVLKYKQVQQMLDIRAAVGLYHDLELSFFLPYTLNNDATYQTRSGITGVNSFVANDPTVGGALFPVPDPDGYRTSQRGLTTMELALAWSPLNDQRDDTKPTITLKVTYGIPIGAAFLPTRSDDATTDQGLAGNQNNAVDLNNPAATGDKIHRLRFDAAFSKRFGVVEPYFALNYTQPFADGGAMPGLQPQNTGGFITGFEMIPWDSPKERQRLSFDVRAGVSYVGPGRTYSEMSGPLRQLTYVDNYANISIGGHLVFQPIEYVRLTSGLTFSHDTNHFITNESPGKAGSGGDVVDLTDPAQVNPHYRQAIDSVGHRFKVEDTTIFTWYVALALML